MVGKVESLNAAVAGSIVLAAARQARIGAWEEASGDELPARPTALERLGFTAEDEDES